MIALSLQLTGHPDQAIGRVNDFLKSDSMRKIAGYTGALVVKENFQQLDETRGNKLGGRRTHYYSSARRSTSFYLDGEDVVINIAQVGIALHYYGGVVNAGVNDSFITGKPTKYLTIPACAEAYGRSASDFENLVIVWGKGRKPVGLAIGVPVEETARRGPVLTKNTRLVPGQVMYWLKESITVTPDKTVLPSSSTLGTAIGLRLTATIRRRFGADVSFDDQADLENDGSGI